MAHTKGASGFECRARGLGGGEVFSSLKRFTKVDKNLYFRHPLATVGCVDLTKTDIKLHLKTLVHCSRKKVESIIPAFHHLCLLLFVFTLGEDIRKS